jgi:LPXTG-motif cell wall-anchored protein
MKKQNIFIIIGATVLAGGAFIAFRKKIPETREEVLELYGQNIISFFEQFKNKISGNTQTEGFVLGDYVGNMQIILDLYKQNGTVTSNEVSDIGGRELSEDVSYDAEKALMIARLLGYNY